MKGCILRNLTCFDFDATLLDGLADDCITAARVEHESTLLYHQLLSVVKMLFRLNTRALRNLHLLITFE